MRLVSFLPLFFSFILLPFAKEIQVFVQHYEEFVYFVDCSLFSCIAFLGLSFDEFFFTHVFFVFLRVFFRVSVSAFELTNGIVVCIVLLGSSYKISSFSSLVSRLIHLFSIILSYCVYLFTFPLSYNLFSSSLDFHNRLITSIIPSLVPTPTLLLLLEEAIVNLLALFFLSLSLLLAGEIGVEIGVFPILVLTLFFFRDESGVLYLY